MAPNRIYRFSIWLPLLVPIATIVIVNVLSAFGMPRLSGGIDVAFEILAGSATFAGLPYLLLALWASKWIRGRTESEIRRLMFIAPIMMVAVFGVACLFMAVLSGELRNWFTTAAWGARIIIPLGYAYVALTLLLRRALGPRRIEIAA